MIKAIQGLIVVAGFALPFATFPTEGLWGGTGGAVVTTICIVGGLVLSGYVGAAAERR